MKTFIGLWVLTGILGITFWGTIFYVSYHFISKMW